MFPERVSQRERKIPKARSRENPVPKMQSSKFSADAVENLEEFKHGKKIIVNPLNDYPVRCAISNREPNTVIFTIYEILILILVFNFRIKRSPNLSAFFKKAASKAEQNP